VYARVLCAQADLRRVDELIRLVNDVLIPAALAQPGNRGFDGFADYSTGKVMTITYWATPEDLMESEASGYLQGQLARAASMLIGPMTLETFAVVTSSVRGILPFGSSGGSRDPQVEQAGG
jgi:hypothetical protein